jgi:hypothetical protein
MSSDAVYDAVKTYLTANWTATPLLFDNELADTAGAVPTDDPGTAFVQVEMAGDFYGAASIGAGDDAANLYRGEGTLFLSVLVPAGTGSRVARQHAKALVDLFRGVELAAGTIRFRGATIAPGQKAALDGNWYELPASVDYQADL